MSIKSEILQLALRLPIGSTIYVTCPSCFKFKKLGITSTYEGLVYHCFSASCQLKGKLETALSKEAIGFNLNKTPLQKKTPFQLPEYLLRGFNSQASIQLALKYSLLEAYRLGLFRTSYDPRLNRQVFFYLDADNTIVGAVGRSLHYTVKPKAFIYEYSDKTPWYCGTGDTAVIVEDIFSAVAACNAGFCGIALSGITLAMDYAERLSKFKTCVVALDKDATLFAFRIKKLLDMYVPNVVLLPLQHDLKDTPVQQIKDILSLVL